MTGRSFRALTRHFVGAIVEPPILTDIGIDALRRTLISVLAFFIALGLFVPRVFLNRYRSLSLLPSPEPFLSAVDGDTLFMLALPMFITGMAAVVVSPMLFPDETDYRVLTPLPVTRVELFSAKLAALIIAAAAGVAAVNAVWSLTYPAVAGGRWAAHGPGARMAAHAFAASVGSAWMVSAVMALQGVCLLAIPDQWRHRVATTLQAAVFLVLLVAFPNFVRLTGRAVTADTVALSPQRYLPPVWFLGVERWLLDGSASGGYARAAAYGAVAWAATLAIIGAAFVVLFQSAETLAGTEGSRRPSAARIRAAAWLRRRLPVRGPEAAVIGFAVRGLLRSRLHQFIFAIVIGCGLAMTAAQIAAVSEGRTRLDLRPAEAVNAAIAAPLIVTLCLTIGLRAAFLLPLDRGAGWVFRMIDDPASRSRALDGVVHVFTIGAVVPAAAVAFVLQPALIGVAVVPSLALTTLASLALVELVVISWRRIPYSCTYLPGKRHLTYTAAILVAAYAVFVVIGSNLVRWSVLHPARIMFTGGLLLALFAAMRRARLRTWGMFPLEFEDDDPAALIVVGLE